MSWASSSPSAAEIAAYQADKPMMLAAQQAYVAALADPRWNTAGTGAAADASATGFEAWYAADLAADHVTRPNASNASWYLVFDLRFASAVFDCIVLLGSNASALTGGITYTVEIATDSAFTVGLTTIFSATNITFSGPIVILLASRYTASGGAGGYLRIRMQTSPAQIPELTEAWIGRRRNFRRSFLRPFTPDMRTKRVETAGPRSGSYAAFSGRNEIQGSIQLSEADPTLDDTATLRTTFAECLGGQLPILFWLRPFSASSDVRLMRWTDPDLVIERSAPGVVSAQIHLRELPPFSTLVVP